MAKPRVNIPKNPGDLLVLATAILAQHQKLGANSPLNSLTETAATMPTVEPAAAQQAEAERLARATEEAYRERDRLIGPIQEWVRLSRDLLLPLNAKNPKALGQWGFTVDDTAAAKPAAKAKKSGGSGQTA